jgi:aryl-alcohol dehydrogenase-like predicted oxidoreductase
MMVGFNLLNQSARERVLALTLQQNIGVLCMFAVRRALSRPEVLRDVMQNLAAQGLVDAGAYDAENPLGFLTEEDVALDVPEAAYRFCRDEPGIDVTLSGTGRVEHLQANADSLSRPPLPPAVVERLKRLFARVDSISGN